MARQARMDFVGALHHVMSRGNAKQAVFHTDGDDGAFTQLLGETCRRFHWTCHAHCLMPNHYHLLVETHEPTLSRGMKHLNGVFTLRHNLHRKRVGHLYQGRFKSILVDSERYLLELARYIVLNPVRARMVVEPAAWRWSSARWLVGAAKAPDWADPSAVQGRLDADRASAVRAFAEYLGSGGREHDAVFSTGEVLGDEQFKARVGVGSVLGAARRSLSECLGSTRDALAIQRAVLVEGYSQAEVARALGVSPATVSRAVRQRGQVFHVASGPPGPDAT